MACRFSNFLYISKKHCKIIRTLLRFLSRTNFVPQNMYDIHGKPVTSLCQMSNLIYSQESYLFLVFWNLLIRFETSDMMKVLLIMLLFNISTWSLIANLNIPVSIAIFNCDFLSHGSDQLSDRIETAIWYAWSLHFIHAYSFLFFDTLWFVILLIVWVSILSL